MSKQQGSISPQEKEKLRKRLQKLFQMQEHFEETAAGGKSSKKNRVRKNKQDRNQQIKGQKEQQITPDKLKQNKAIPKKIKKQQQTNKDSPTSSDEITTKKLKKQQQQTHRKDATASKKQPQAHNEIPTSSEETTPKKLNNQQQTHRKVTTASELNTKQNGFVKAPKPATSNSNLNKHLTKSPGLADKNGKQKDSKVQKKQTAPTTKTNETAHTKESPTKQNAKTKNIKTNGPKMVNKKEVKENVQKKTADKKNIKATTAEIKKKSQAKSQHDAMKKTQQGNEPKTGKTSTLKQNNSPKTTQTTTKMNNNQKKRAKKRAASSEYSPKQETATTTNKKAKLTNKSSKLTKENPSKSNKKHKTPAGLSVSSSSQLEDEYDISGMQGLVRGGDFDSDSEEDDMEHNYWMQEENYSSDEDDDDNENDNANESSSSDGDDNVMQKFKKNTETGLEQYEHNDVDESGSEEEYFDSDEEDEFDDSEDEEEEEEEDDETHSDFDENDYEEDEDSYNYDMDSEDDYSSNYNNMSYDFNDNDGDDGEYKLPEHVPEDLIIHRGTATKRDLKPEDNITFDSDNEESQIIELAEQDSVKVISQPKAYDREELLKLKYEEKTVSTIATFHKKRTMSAGSAASENSEDCPKLVPIVDEDGFQLYNPNDASEDEEVPEDMEGEEEGDYEDDEEEYGENESMEEYENDDDMDDISLGSEYTEINSDDADSLMSEDINEKYLNRGHDDSESDYSIDEDMWNKKHKVDVIDATGYKCENKVATAKDLSDNSLNDDIKQIPSLKLYENVDLKTGSSILSTTIIDKKVFKSADNSEMELEVKTTNKQVEQNNKPQKVPEQEAELKEPEPKEVVEKSPPVEVMAAVAENEKPEQSVKAVKSTGQSLVDYNTKFFNALDSNLVAVLLKDPFYIYGTVRLTLLAGSVEVYGHSLSLNTEVEVFSPRGCSMIEIAPSSVKKPISKQHLNQTLKSYEQHFALADLKAIVDSYNSKTDAVVLLKRNECRKKVVQQFKKFMNENVFPNINNINVDRPLYNAEYLLKCVINTSAQEQKCLRLPQQWQQISVTSKSRVMLAGGKSVGKSTLLRYLINRHMPQQILLIDLDIGQPEVFVPQTVSCTIVKQPLLGPGFMLNLQPEMSYAVGHTNIALCAHKYLDAVRSLIAYCKEQQEYKHMPWVINTMGYNKGFGLELISVIAQELPLTDLIQLQSSREINNFDSILHVHVLSNVPRIMFTEECTDDTENLKEKLKYRLHVWQSAVQQESRYQKEWEMSAKDMRFAMLLARLSEALQGHAEWLTDIKPLSASLNDLKIVNLMVNTAEASEEELARSVEANLVYLCHHEEDNNNKPLKCAGIGVVRAIDYHVQQLYLIPAIPYTKLKEVNCVALGEMPLPSSLFTNQGSRVKNTAPFVYNTVEANASKAIKQIYHRPRKFLTGKHKTLE